LRTNPTEFVAAVVDLGGQTSGAIGAAVLDPRRVQRVRLVGEVVVGDGRAAALKPVIER